MSEAWQTLAENYARFDTPLKPNYETVAAIRSLCLIDDPLVVVLGSTSIYSDLGQKVWFVDAMQEALQLVKNSPGFRRIHKNWFEASDELKQADMLVGDGSMNAIDSLEGVESMLNIFKTNLKKGSLLVQRIFIRHELSEKEFIGKLTEAFVAGHYSEIRLLIYGVVPHSNGVISIADVDIYINTLETHIPIERTLSDTFKQKYFDWRGMSAEKASQLKTKAFFPSAQQIEGMFEGAGFKVNKTSAGSFSLAEYTPIYFVTV